jgi:hypothetical protein
MLLAVSPNERQAVVSHDPRPPWCTCNPHSAPQCTDAVDTEISIVTIGAPTVAVATRAHGAQFSPDGRFIMLGSGGCNDNHAEIVRSDGSDLQANPGYFFEPGWIYSSDQTGLYRQQDLSAPREFVGGPGPAALSPDGQAVFICSPSNATDCSLQSPVGARPVPVPGASWWSPDGNYVFAYPCTLFDRSGRQFTLCDPASLVHNTFARWATSTAVFVTADAAGFTVHARDFVTGSETTFAPFATPTWTRLTPDGASIVAGVAYTASPAPDDPSAIYVAPASGGGWTKLADRVRDLSTSPDSRVVAMGSFDQHALFLSADGGTARPISVPGLSLSWLTPDFEPAGGSGKALYFEYRGVGDSNTVVGNEDGSGDWLRLVNAFCGGWFGHTALCEGGGRLIFVHGEQAGTVAEQVSDWRYAKPARKLFFVTPAGLNVVDNPGP